ncbi:hypothetical protein V1264_012728 [Littorina saxatilis]|uniref:Uncharacterized protein n=1 Tax=Littorina saxatilis TaxID=31220 RepID=A0AAN9BX42_9CAEN
MSPATCHVCSEWQCEHEVEWIMECPPESPYCANGYVNHADGSHELTRKCAFQSECDDLMLGATVNSTQCQNWQPESIYLDDFDCFYCCTTDHCNRHSKPDPSTWYTGH